MNKLLVSTLAALTVSAAPVYAQPADILNASYDIARELFAAINEAYTASGATITVNQSHAGSSAQARAILEGLAADVVTFNQVTDVQRLVDGEFVSADWASEFPNNATPFYSFPSFLVRAGNPKNLNDWGDLAAEGVQIIFPNPKTSGNGRYTYLAARAWATEEYAGDEAKVEEFLTKLFNNVPVFETGGRAATTAFTERQLGDVLITFEAEALAVTNEFGADKYQPVTPSVSFLSEFPVAIVDKVVDARNSRDAAKAYLDFLFSPEGQEVAAANFHRPTNQEVLAKHADRFPEVRLVTVEEEFGGWQKAAEDHFADGGLLDKVFLNQ